MSSPSSSSLMSVQVLESAFRKYMEYLEKGAQPIDFQNFIISIILLQSGDEKLNKDLQKLLPTTVEDWDVCKALFEDCNEEAFCQEMFDLNLEKNVQILDVAFGPGDTAMILKEKGFENVDSVNPVTSYLMSVMKYSLYKRAIHASITNDQQKTPIGDNSYHVVLCPMGIFPRTMEASALNEFVRIVKPGGYIIWDKPPAGCDQLIDQLIKDEELECLKPAIRDHQLASSSNTIYVLKKL